MKIRLYLITLLILVGVQWLWLTLFGKFYPLPVENFPPGSLRWVVIGGLYLLYAFAFVHFAVAPFLRPGSFNQAAFNGGFLGMLGSAGNFWSNLTVRHLPLWLVMVDVVWWTIIMAGTAAFVVWLGRKWQSRTSP
jgi:uncharacterized membrane protein